MQLPRDCPCEELSGVTLEEIGLKLLAKSNSTHATREERAGRRRIKDTWRKKFCV